MAYFGLSLLALGMVTELEVQSSSFSQLTFIHELFFSFSPSSARYRKYRTKTIFQQMISIRGTIPKRLLAHLVFIPNKYLIFRGAIRLTKPFVKQNFL